MLRVSIGGTSGRKGSSWIAAVAASLCLHLGFLHGATNWAETRQREQFEPSRIEFRADEPAPEPEAEPEPAPEPEPEPEVAAARPRPNSSKPAPPPAPAAEQPVPVFGVTADSVVGGDSSVAVRVGNTLEKPMEKELTEPAAVSSLPPSRPAPAPAPEPKRPVDPVPVFELSKAPTFKKKVEPEYPEAAKSAGIEGTVQLEVLIDEQGRVRKIRVLRSPGHGLDKAAIAALSRSRFNPAYAGGKAVPVRIKIPYRFVLDG